MPDTVTFERTGAWDRVERILANLERDAAVAIEATLGRLGGFYEGQVQKGIVSQAPAGEPFEPLAASTILRKGSSSALIHHGDLLGAITSKVLDGAVFVGLLRTAKGREGEDLANLGEIHEFGTKDGRIPARPFLGPIAGSRRLRGRALQIAEDTFANTMYALRGR